MPRYRKHAEKRTQLLLTPGVTIPVVLHYEARPGGRVAVGRRALIMRIPVHCAEAEQQRVVAHFTDWARRLYSRSPEKLAHLIDRPVGTGGTIRVMDRDFHVAIHPGDHPTQSRMERDPAQPDRLHVYRAQTAAAEGGSREVEILLGRMLAKIFRPEITARVHELNDRHFQQVIRAVRLKLMDSRWGSCTQTGNVTLSSRMLLAPAPVRDAVIVHELAHLIELNHGPRFWALVYEAVPDYREHDRWLKRYGADLRFVLTPV